MSFDPNLDNYREILRTCKIEDISEAYGLDVDYINDMVAEFGGNSDLDDDSTLADGLDVALEIIDDITGIHLEEELLDYLGGDLIVAIRDFDFDLIQRNPEQNAVDAVTMLSYLPNNKDDLEDTLEDIIDTTLGYVLLESNYERVDVGATDEARVFEIDGIGYSPRLCAAQRLSDHRHYYGCAGSGCGASKRKTVKAFQPAVSTYAP